MPDFITDGDFTTASAVSGKRFSTAFPGVVALNVLEQDFWINIANFSAVALNTAHAAPYATYYLVEETAPQLVSHIIRQWTRIYAEIPAARSEYESYSAQFPGYDLDSIGILFDLVATFTTTAGVSTITSTAAHGVVANDTILIGYILLSQSSGSPAFDIQQRKEVARKVIAAPTTTTLTVKQIDDVGTMRLTRAMKRGLPRESFSESVMSRVDFAYYLPGVSGGITTVDDITIIEPVRILNNYGARTDKYSDLTDPLRSAYEATIGDWVVAEPSTVRRWKGNIYERATRYVIAQ